MIGFVAATVYRYVGGYYHGLGYPYNTFLFLPQDHFMDFYNPLRYNRLLEPYSAPFAMAYLPFAHSIMYILSRLFSDETAYALVALAFTGVISAQTYLFGASDLKDRFFKLQTLVILAFLSYPVLFIIDRGNIEMIMYLFLALFFYAYYVRDSRWSFVFLSMAIAMKLYPATLLVLLVGDKKYKEASAAALLSLALTAGSYLFLALISGHSFPSMVAMSIKSMGTFKEASFALQGIRDNHTIWGVVALTLALAQKQAATTTATVTSMTNGYTIFAAIFFAGISAYVILIERAVWRKVALLIISMILLPYASYDYTLISIFFPILLFLNADTMPWETAAFSVLFGAMLVNVNYGYFVGDVGYSVVLYPVVMGSIIASIIVSGLHDARRAENRRPAVTPQKQT